MHLSKWDKEEDYEDRSVYRRYEDEDHYDDEEDEDYFDGWGGNTQKRDR